METIAEGNEIICTGCGREFYDGDECMIDEHVGEYFCIGRCWDRYTSDAPPPDSDEALDPLHEAVGIEAYSHWNEDAGYMWWQEEGRHSSYDY